ncbi:MAG: Na+:solute symporter [Sedimentisphaeraceae bacterium JB056]
MTILDWLVIFLYCILLLAVGAIFSRKNKTSSDMFAAGRQSPWWISGISAYMTMFSAGTFVVWGGMAYDYGFVAISVSLCYGVAAFFAGLFFAGYWRKMGLSTAAEFIQLRFGNSAFHFYTWFKLIFMSFFTGLTLYGLAVMLCPLISLPEGHFLANAATGTLSVDWACIILGAIVIFYTMSGGLWAVLLTDTLQFFVLMLAVIMVVPLSISKIGGFENFTTSAPEGFFALTSGKFTWLFLLGWMLTNMFQLGGEWHFIQRYFCVPSVKDARKSCYLFSVLYLTTPFLWMLPPMIYKVVDPNADPEQAYILMCKSVLPAGMVGMMIAAMFSATASSLSSLLNVNASVLTNDVYKKIFRPEATEKQVIVAGRVITIVMGVWLLSGSIILPRLTSYRNFVLVFGSMIGSSILMPTIWALRSKKIGQSAVWLTVSASVVVGFIVKFVLSKNGMLSSSEMFAPIINFVDAHSREVDAAVGILTPLTVLTICELKAKEYNAGWKRLNDKVKSIQDTEIPTIASTMPAKVILMNLGILSLMLAIMALLGNDRTEVLWAAAAIFFFTMLAGSVPIVIRILKEKKTAVSS